MPAQNSDDIKAIKQALSDAKAGNGQDAKEALRRIAERRGSKLDS